MLDLHYVTTTFGWSGFASVWLIALLPLMSVLIPDERLLRLSVSLSSENWMFLLAFAMLGGVIPHLLFYRSLEKISASAAGIVLLLEPVSATILAWLFFSQNIGFSVIAGGVLILVSNYLIIREERTETPVF